MSITLVVGLPHGVNWKACLGALAGVTLLALAFGFGCYGFDKFALSAASVGLLFRRFAIAMMSSLLGIVSVAFTIS